MSFCPAAALDDLWSGEMCGVVVGGHRILLVHLDGQVRAFADRCAHQGVPISEGRLEGREIVCRAHEWRYDALTGVGKNPAGARLKPLPVRLEGGRILVDTATCAEGWR